MQLKGQAVKHSAFGKGIITEADEKRLTVCFAQGEKRFLWPDAFSCYLTLKDERLQSELVSMVRQKERRLQKEKQHEMDSIENQIRLRSLKISLKSQAAFDVDAQQLRQLNEEGFLTTGVYPSGPRKGQARVPSSIKPNTACLLTQRLTPDDELSRHILGVCMVCDDFWGEACTEGQVRIHERYRLMLPSPVPFWPFFASDKPAWGNTPYKVFSLLTMRSILKTTLAAFENSTNEATARDFYRYYCNINQLIQ